MGNSTKEKVQAIPLESDAAGIAARKKIFRGFDVNGNNWLSLAEIDKGLRDVLELPELFDAKPVIMRAYQALPSQGEEQKPSYRGFGESRCIQVYLDLPAILLRALGGLQDH